MTSEIEALTEADIKRIADKVGDALQELYWMALEIMLDEYLHEVRAQGK